WSPSLLPRHFLAPSVSFFLTHTPTTEIYPLSLHDALPIWPPRPAAPAPLPGAAASARRRRLGHPPPPRGRPAVVQVNLVQRGLRSEEHTSELQSRENLVCRLLLEKKKIKSTNSHTDPHQRT